MKLTKELALQMIEEYRGKTKSDRWINHCICVGDTDKKRGKLYSVWLRDKTEKVINEKDDNYIYRNVITYTLPKYVITQYTFNKSNKTIKNIINKNYNYKENTYTFSNTKISIELGNK